MQLDLHPIISIITSGTSLMHVVISIHDSVMNKLPCISHVKIKQMVYVFAKLLITKLSFRIQII